LKAHILSNVNLFEAFRASACTHAAKTAMFWGDDLWSYERLWQAAAGLAVELRQLEPGPSGKRIGLWMKNCPEFAAGLFGIFGAGHVAVPINNFLKPGEVGQILEDAEIDLLLCDDSTLEARAALLEIRPNLRFLDLQSHPFSSSGGDQFAQVSTASEELAILIYSSGTTGRPKGIMLSHGNLLHNVESCRIMLQAVDMDRFVALLPMFHSFMLTVSVLLPLLIGGSLVILRSLHQPKAVIAEIIRRQATILPSIPQFFRGLCHPSIPRDLPLRICISGGAPLPAEILKDFTQNFPIPLIEGYGLSEASPVVCFNPLLGPWKAGSIGVPIPNVEVSVQNDAGEILADGTTGEICVRGGNVMLGYWRNPAETALAMRQGWLLTGDIGHRDADGYFYITDRRKDMLLVNGINVFPREIEEVIYRFPGVREAAVVGFPDARRGEQPVAFVSAAEGHTLDLDRLTEFVRESVADYKAPRHFKVLPALPRNSTGKVMKTVLRQQSLT
jgi:long-chain acyl-CoA synthetase